jgi:hypothetical protein
MTLWLEHKEKIYRHEKHIQWRLDGCPSPPVMDQLPPGIVYERQLKMTKHPTYRAVRLSRLITDYGAQFFRHALARFIVKFNNPSSQRARLRLSPQKSAFRSILFQCSTVLNLPPKDPYAAHGPSDSVVDSIHVQPRRQLTNGEDVPARFDIALVNDSRGGMIGVTGE